MRRSAQVAGGLLGAGGAQALIAVGLAVLLGRPGANGPIETGVALLAAGAFLAMVAVADRLVPDAGDGFTRALKAGMVALVFLAGALAVYSTIAGPYDLLAPP